MLLGCPFWNSIVRRSYPVCIPVRTASTYASGGGAWGAPNAEGSEQMNGCGDAVGLGLVDAVGAGDVVGVLVPCPPGVGWNLFSGLPTSRAPTRITAITAAARAAIHTWPCRSGASSTSAERTRSDRAGLGDPLMASNASPISRRKSSRVTLEHLLEGQIRPQLASCSVDT